MSKKVVISGYYGFNNLGDEAVLYSMLNTLRGRMPGLDVTVLSNDPPATARDYGVRAVNRWNVRAVAGALRRADLLISGGGSLLQDVTGPRSLLYYLGVIWLARLLGRPVVYYAQGIGPVTTGPGRRLVGVTTGGARAVTVRDRESMLDLRDMGVRRPVEVVADPVLGLHRRDIDLTTGAELLRRNGIAPGSGRLVGVSVRPLPGGTGWETEVARACDLLAQAGCTVMFIPMQSPADLEKSREVASAMGEPHVIISERLNVPLAVSVVGNLDLLLGMRLHALIFAAVCGTLPLGIVYDPKVERFLRRLGVPPADRPEELKYGELALMAGDFLRNRQVMGERMAARVRELRVEAGRPAEVVQEILGL